MAKREHFIGVDAIEKQLKAAKKELVDIQNSLKELEDVKKSFDLVYNGYTKFRAGEGFSKLEMYCESKKRAKELGIKIADIAKKIEEFKQNPILLAMYDRVKECKKSVNYIRDEITDAKAKKQNIIDNIRKSNLLIE